MQEARGYRQSELPCASSLIFRCELEARFLEVLSDGGHRLPDEAQKLIGEPACIADSFYEPNSCVF